MYYRPQQPQQAPVYQQRMIPLSQTTFQTQKLPLPTQIHNQRVNNQRMVSEAQLQQHQFQQSYAAQIQNRQKQRFEKGFLYEMNSEEYQEVKVPLTQPTKPWMGDDVYMTSLFLGIEMGRLIEDNDHLITENEKNEHNVRSLLQIERQIHQYRQQMGEYEKQIALLQSEREKWKTRSNKGNDGTEYQRKMIIDKEIRELTAKFISDRNHLENENKQQKKILEELRVKELNLDEMIIEAQQQQDEQKRLKRELDNFKRGFEELESVLRLAGDIENENIQLKQKIYYMKDKIHKNSVKDPRLEEKIREARVQNEMLREQLSKNLKYNQILQYQGELDDLQEQMRLSDEQHRNLTNQLNFFEQQQQQQRQSMQR